MDLFSICHSKEDAFYFHFSTQEMIIKKWSGKATVRTMASWGPEKNVRTIFRWLSENQ